MKATTFWKDNDDNKINTKRQQNNEGEKANRGWVLCNSFQDYFMVGLFFSIRFYQPHKKIYQQIFVIIYKLSTIEGFCHKKNILPWSWFFF